MTTPQQLDPLGGVTARPLVAAAVVAALTTAAVMLALSYRQVTVWPLQIAALGLLVAACVTLLRGSSPFRAPFTRGRNLLIHGLMVGAVVLGAISQVGANTSLRDDWGPVCIAIVVLMTGSYRPTGEILLATFGSCIVLANTAIGIALVREMPVSVYVIVAVLPLLASGSAAAGFSRSLVADLRQWRGDASTAQRDAIDELRSELAPSVRAARVALLNAEVVPFLRRVVESGQLSAEDSDTARSLAGVLRATMTPDLGANWLDRIADAVDDTELLAETMGTEQRASLGALLAELKGSGHLVPGSLEVRLVAQDRSVLGQVHGRVTETLGLRSQLAPYFAVAASFFPGARLEIGADELLLEFTLPLV